MKTLLIAILCAGLLTARSQSLPPEAVSEYRSVVGNRIEAITILGGDYGISGGTYTSSGNSQRNVDLSLSKFGGAGDIGDPQPIGHTGIGWQPRLQGEMGYADAKNNFTSGDLNGDTSEYKSFAIQFGGGARFWFNEHLSLAPTFMGMYGHTEDDYTAHSAFGQANLDEAQSLGLVNWTADTWTVRPAANIQYLYTWRRTIFTLSSDPAYFHTESFHTSNSNLKLNGDSETWKNMIDVDIPLGQELFGHELRTGGYFDRIELYDNIRSGLNTTHIYELHGRVVLDFLGELWKVQWIGIGGSYLWGSNFTGWSFGADIAFRF